MIEEFKNQIDILFRNEKNLIYDAGMQQTIEDAKSGSPLAWLDLYESFLWGYNQKRRLSEPRFKVVRNLNIARFFNRQLINYLKWNLGLDEKQPFTTWKQQEADYQDLMMEMHEAAIIEGMAGNYTEAKKLYLETIDLMLNNLQPEQWDFEIFRLLETLVEYSNLAEAQ